MALSVGTNTYVSRSEADAYFSNRLHSSGWLAASIKDRENALVAGTAAVDRLGFAGVVAHRDQRFAWPRFQMRDRAGRPVSALDVPDAVKAAACEYAFYLLITPQPVQPVPAVAQKRVGDLEIRYRAAPADPIPSAVRQLLAPFLLGSAFSVEMIP